MSGDVLPVKSHHVRVGVGVHLMRLLAESGVEPRLFLVEHGLDPSLFDSRDNTLPFAVNARLYKSAAEQARFEGLPILVGLSASLEDLGPLGEEMRKASTVYAAWKTAEKAFLMHASGVKISVTTANDLFEVRYTILDSEVESGGHISSGALASMASLMVEMCGNGCRPVSADLPLREPQDKTIFIRAFGKNVKFDCAEAVVRFNSIWMRKAPLCGAADLDNSGPGRFDDEIIEIVEAACVRESLEGRVPLLEVIAEQMGWSTRTLSRRLKQRGTSFDDIRRASIRGAAIRLLIDTDMSVTAISMALGYSEVAAFTRAFHSWTGFSPTHVRLARTARPEAP